MVMDAGLNATKPLRDKPDPSGHSGPKEGDASPHKPSKSHLPDAHKLAQDWVTLWQSELSAMAADPEVHESWQTVMTLWAGTLSTVMQGFAREPNTSGHDDTRQRSGPSDASGSAARAAAPDARDVEIERLARHVDALERRLAELERDGDSRIHPAVRPRHGSDEKSRSNGVRR